ncbi:unnamed protein product [Amoebophrya sp. A25]|nr:unnamed protein product [Amoebophrya sp. A25]|eukprot:GSA25T00018663001.1
MIAPEQATGRCEDENGTWHYVVPESTRQSAVSCGSWLSRDMLVKSVASINDACGINPDLQVPTTTGIFLDFPEDFFSPEARRTNQHGLEVLEVVVGEGEPASLGDHTAEKINQGDMECAEKFDSSCSAVTSMSSPGSTIAPSPTEILVTKKSRLKRRGCWWQRY